LGHYRFMSQSRLHAIGSALSRYTTLFRSCECRQDTVHAAVWFGQHQAGWRPAWSTLRVCRAFSNVLQIQFRPKTAFPTRVGLPKDRKSTRLNSSHVSISYADFCLKIKM